MDRRLRDRFRVVALKQAGFSYADITKRTGKSKSYIQRWLDRETKEEDMDDKPRSGRPPVVPPSQRQAIKKQLKKHSSVPKVMATLKQKGVNASRSTVWRIAKETQMRSVITRRKPLLTQDHKRGTTRIRKEVHW